MARHRYELFISASVLDEIRRGDPDAAARRLALVEGLPVVEVNEDVSSLFGIYNKELGLPERAEVDVLHIAFAVGFGMDYLLTWNCVHIANGEVVRRLLGVNETLGKPTPVIVTPEELPET
ncbi:MAG: type II toxin-antitoxin system VapC family toxin [Deltaproteobacteria bacterium]|nr:type II toxin-antitoxin system VapC family toxin [Deltaproteobacteria bacterium]